MNIVVRAEAGAQSRTECPAHLEALSAFLERTRYEDLPSEVVNRTIAVILDTLGVIAAGSREPEMDRLISLQRRAARDEGCTILGATKPADVRTAALLNGTSGTFLELDEGHRFARGHPAIHVVPAALAIAEAEHLAGEDLILAVALGYDIAARVGTACNLRPHFHPHGTWGVVGAVAAARG